MRHRMPARPITPDALRRRAIALTRNIVRQEHREVRDWRPTYADVKKWASRTGICLLFNDAGSHRAFISMGVVKVDPVDENGIPMADWNTEAMAKL